ncbi:hypothetical protein [Bacillus cereus group sp. BfR-BA-01383]|uniref:hypothetical protein n=1 Tax=Bacillus cereus group sp. BfR-BA-01383 TaxID=2920327 RepID=UPI001F57088E|nr:hypothetical protein [Bacillus cereus group sp. BfR-BA-01383]
MPCVVIDFYIAPDSIITDAEFREHVRWVNQIWRVGAGIDIRYRFRDPTNTRRIVRVPVDGPIVLPGQSFPCEFTIFEDIPENLQADLDSRPTGTGPWPVPNEIDVAVFYINGPITLDNGDLVQGCAPIETPNILGPSVIIANPIDQVFTNCPQILAHELGHVFNLPHVDAEDNIMHVPLIDNVSINLTQEQINIAHDAIKNLPDC